MECLSTLNIRKAIGLDSMLRELASKIVRSRFIAFKGHDNQWRTSVTGKRPLEKSKKEDLGNNWTGPQLIPWMLRSKLFWKIFPRT